MIALGSRVARGVRLTTAGMRALPDFIIIGASKCGTTSLYDYLTSHPLVLPAAAKEVHFFDDLRNFDRGQRWYRSWFPRQSTLDTAAKGFDVERAICGESTPIYLAHQKAPARIAATVPTARLIVLLRNPVERAWSQYRMFQPWMNTDEDFGTAVRAEADRLPGGFSMLEDRQSRHLFVASSLATRGRYAEQLAWWFAEFPRHQLLMLRSEDLFADPENTFGRVCEFLGLPSVHRSHFAVRNQGANTDEIDPEVRAYLEEYFAEPNAELAELTDGMIAWPSA